MLEKVSRPTGRGVVDLNNTLSCFFPEDVLSCARPHESEFTDSFDLVSKSIAYWLHCHKAPNLLAIDDQERMKPLLDGLRDLRDG